MTTYTLSRPPATITCVEAVPRALAERWLDEQAGWFQGSRGSRRVELEGGALAKLHSSSLVRSLFLAAARRPARPRRAFRIGLALAGAGVRAARPLAFIEESQGGLVRRGCLVVAVIDAVDLRRFILERVTGAASGEPRERLKRELWSAVASEVARLHGASVRQRDLKAPNVLVAEGEGGRLEASLIDLEGMALGRAPPPEPGRVRDLGRLAASLRAPEVMAAGVSEADWRFLVARYLEAAEGGSPAPRNVERVAAATLAWAAWKEARNRRRKLPLH